jgi:RNA polymerase sigma-70 factor (ECF subfamily)
VSSSERDPQRFAEIFRALSPRVHAYARRHGDAAGSQDVTAETFLVAWRRFDQLPADPLPWLLGIARNVLRNQARGDLRRDRLVLALTHSMAQPLRGPGADAAALERAQLAEALTRLSERDRESLLLVAWDGLTATQAAAVSGCTVNTFARRLSRARARLATALAEPPLPPPVAEQRPLPLSPVLRPTERQAR